MVQRSKSRFSIIHNNNNIIIQIDLLQKDLLFFIMSHGDYHWTLLVSKINFKKGTGITYFKCRLLIKIES